MKNKYIIENVYPVSLSNNQLQEQLNKKIIRLFFLLENIHLSNLDLKNMKTII